MGGDNYRKWRLWIALAFLALALLRAAHAYAWTDDPLARKWRYMGTRITNANQHFTRPGTLDPAYYASDQLWHHFNISDPDAHGTQLTSIVGTTGVSSPFVDFAGPNMDAEPLVLQMDTTRLAGSADATSYAFVFSYGGFVRQSDTNWQQTVDTRTHTPPCPIGRGSFSSTIYGASLLPRYPEQGASEVWTLAHPYTAPYLGTPMFYRSVKYLLAYAKNANGTWRVYERFLDVPLGSAPLLSFETSSASVPTKPLTPDFAATYPRIWSWSNQAASTPLHLVMSGGIVSGETTDTTIVSEILSNAGTLEVPAAQEATTPPTLGDPWGSADASTAGVPDWMPAGTGEWIGKARNWIAGLLDAGLAPLRSLFFFLQGG